MASRASVQNEGTQQEVTNFEVRIGILRPEVPIRPGMSARVDIQTETASHALSVPIQSVTLRDRNSGTEFERVTDGQGKHQKSITDPDMPGKRSTRVLFIVQGDSVKIANVELGIADDNYIQIISGIKADDEVVTGPYTAISRDLEEGVTVKNDSL
jgi:HlyD family secretion protein